MNSTIRTVHRVVFFVGALLTGVLLTSFGYGVTLGLARNCGPVGFSPAE